MIERIMQVHRTTAERDTVRLSRTIRVSLPLHGSGASINGHNARPAPAGYALFYEFVVECQGKPDAQTGYLISIKDIDRAFHDEAYPILARSLGRARAEDAPPHLAQTLSALFDALGRVISAPLTALTWRLTPNQTMTMRTTHEDSDNTDAGRAVLVCERAEFAAAHRLAVPEFDDDKNRAVFGKCANPHAHGHNYILETCVAIPGDRLDRCEHLQGELAALTDAHLVEVLDHKNLNVDVPAFDQGGGGMIPSVENIARFCYETLSPRVSGLGLELVCVTVWETERTSARYPA